MIVYWNKNFLKGRILPPLEILNRSCKMEFLLRQADASKYFIQNSTGCSIAIKFQIHVLHSRSIIGDHT